MSRTVSRCRHHSNLFPALSNQACSNRNCRTQFRRLQGYIKSLEASVTTDRRKIYFLEHRNEKELNNAQEASTAEEYDGNTTNYPQSSPEPSIPKDLTHANYTSTTTAQTRGNLPITRSLTAMSTSRSMQSLCNATGSGMIITRPSTPVNSVTVPASDDFIVNSGRTHAYLRISQAPFTLPPPEGIHTFEQDEDMSETEQESEIENDVVALGAMKALDQAQRGRA
jgi:hypothetical protein